MCVKSYAIPFVNFHCTVQIYVHTYPRFYTFSHRCSSSFQEVLLPSLILVNLKHHKINQSPHGHQYFIVIILQLRMSIIVYTSNIVGVCRFLILYVLMHSRFDTVHFIDPSDFIFYILMVSFCDNIALPS